MGGYLVVEQCHSLEVKQGINGLARGQVVQFIHLLADLCCGLLASRHTVPMQMITVPNTSRIAFWVDYSAISSRRELG